MKRPSLNHAVTLIAYNDEPSEMAVGVVAQMMSVHLVAELFGLTPVDIANRVVRERERRDEQECNR